MNYVGIDHRQYSHLTLMDQTGQVLRSGRVPNLQAEIAKFPEVYRRSVENRKAQRVLRQRAFYVSAMTALKNRVYAFLAQQKEDVREEVARKTNIFSTKGQKAL